MIATYIRGSGGTAAQQQTTTTAGSLRGRRSSSTTTADILALGMIIGNHSHNCSSSNNNNNNNKNSNNRRCRFAFVVSRMCLCAEPNVLGHSPPITGRDHSAALCGPPEILCCLPGPRHRSVTYH
jgi:hypothetical protein